MHFLASQISRSVEQVLRRRVHMHFLASQISRSVERVLPLYIYNCSMWQAAWSYSNRSLNLTELANYTFPCFVYSCQREHKNSGAHTHSDTCIWRKERGVLNQAAKGRRESWMAVQPRTGNVMPKGNGDMHIYKVAFLFFF